MRMPVRRRIGKHGSLLKRGFACGDGYRYPQPEQNSFFRTPAACRPNVREKRRNTMEENDQTLFRKKTIDKISSPEQSVENGDELLTLYFAKTGDAEKTDITFTENTLGNGSAMAFVINGQIVELFAETTDGSITFEPIIYGDANTDGIVTAADAAMVLRSIVGLSAITKRGALNAEVSGDGSVTAADAAEILRYVIGLIRVFPVQQP